MTNLRIFMEAQKLLGEKRSEQKEPKKREFSYLATKLPQTTLKSFDWNVERRIYKKLCQGDPMPRVSNNTQSSERKWGPILFLFVVLPN